VARISVGFLLAFGLWALASAGFAQTSETPAPAPKAVVKTAKPSVSGLNPSTAAGLSTPYTLKSFDASDKAAKDAILDEGRKKFFEQSSGFDNTGTFDTGVSVSPTGGAQSGGGGGLSPGLGLKF
jgi:hypothetical protein